MFDVVQLNGNDDDENLLRRFYDALCANFGEDELDEFPIMLEELRGEDKTMDLICLIALGPLADGGGARPIMGGVVWEYFRTSRCMLFTYLLIEEQARGKGLGLQLSIASWRAALQFEDSRNVTFRAIFVEIHDPRHVAGGGAGEDDAVTTDAIDPLERVRTFQHMGVRQVSDFQYIMPPLRPGLPPLPYLLGVVITPRTPRHEGQLYIPTDVVRDFVTGFWEDQQLGEGWKADLDFQGMMRSLDGRPRVDLSDFDLTPPPPRVQTLPAISSAASAVEPIPAAVAPPLLPRATSAARCSVVVVGAGLAGLACARELNAYRGPRGAPIFDVVVLEARNRIGGRVYTARTEDERVDLGASWLHGLHGNCAATLLAASARGVREDELSVTDWTNMQVHAADGAVIPMESLWQAAMRFERFTEVYRTQVETGCSPPTRDFGAAADALAELYAARPDLRCREDEVPAERAAWNYMLSVSESENAAGLDELSALDAFDESGTLEGGDNLRRGGMRALPLILSEGVDVRFATEVQRVVHSGGGVELKCRIREARDQSRAAVFACDVAVLTLPIGVLQAGDEAVAFDPPLPLWKRAAISRIGNGLFNKVVLRFPAPFWPKHAHFGFNHALGSEGEEEGGVGPGNDAGLHTTRRNLWFVNYYPVCQQPILVALVSATLAREMQAMNDDAVVERVLRALRLMFGASVVPVPSDVKISRWGQDKWARGSYAYWRKRASLDDFDAVARPLDGEAVLFAGEATSRRRWGYMDGAIESGWREARRIIARRGGVSAL